MVARPTMELLRGTRQYMADQLACRRRVYERGLWVQFQCPRGLVRDSGPQVYTEREALTHRLYSWVSVLWRVFCFE